jgi:hypothetical protein
LIKEKLPTAIFVPFSKVFKLFVICLAAKPYSRLEAYSMGDLKEKGKKENIP